MKIAIGGFGAVGGQVGRHLDRGVPGLELVAVAARDKEKAARAMAAFSRPVPVVEAGALAEAADVVVECAPAAALRLIAEPALKAGRTLVVISAGALLAAEDLFDLAAAHGAQIIVPSGAVLGLDAVSAAAEGEIESVRMVTRKPIGGLIGAPFIVQHGIEIENIEEPLLLFEGSARDAAVGFPANINVAAALSLAGIGADRTMVQIWADPGVTRNTHSIEVVSDSANFSMKIENIPSKENPRTGIITALSIIAALRKLAAPVRVGT